MKEMLAGNFWGWGSVHKRAEHSDAFMTGILVTWFNMGQIGVEDLQQMAADESGWRGARLRKRFCML